MTAGQVAERVLENLDADSFAGEGGAEAATDPATILAFVKLLLSLCPRKTDVEVQRAASNALRPLLGAGARASMMNVIAAKHPGMGRRARKALLFASLETGATAEPGEVEAVRAMEV